MLNVPFEQKRVTLQATVALVALLVVAAVSTRAQTYTMQNATVNTCSGVFYDSGGAAGNYANSQNLIMTFCGLTGQNIQMVFTQFAVETNWDFLYVYDGASVAAPLIGQYTGNGLGVSPGTVVSSSGCLTFRFTSDGSIVWAGWAATISCVASEGCTDPEAFNFDPNAAVDDGSCFYDCTSGPIYTESFCYGNNASISLYYPPPAAGENITIVFSQGQVETFTWDQLNVYDGATGAPILYQNPFGTVDLSGLVLQSTNGNGITITLVSDGSGSCASGSFVPIIYNIYCGEGGCTNALAPNYNPNASWDNNTCQPCFSAEENGCPYIDAGEDVALGDCPTPCETVELEAEFLDIGATTSYSVCAIEYNPYPFNIGIPFSLGTDDIWSNIIALPFNFCFYGNVYTQLVVGSNGLLTFDLLQANRCCAWSFNAPCPTPLGSAPFGTSPDCGAVTPLIGLYNNSIMGPFHDIDPSPFACGTITYQILGSAPCRRFVVSFNNVCHFSCNNLRTTSQIVLYETTNVIEVFIQDKPTCAGWNGGRAVIGIQNINGTQGVTPAGRNTGQWTASNEGWRFIPSGESIVDVTWYAQGEGAIGSGPSLDVCPEETSQSFVAEAVYTRCDGTQITLEDIVTVTCAQILLPVEWLDFQARLINDEREVRCLWLTASETNNDYFTVERSADGYEFVAIGQVAGSGNSSVTNSYQWVDPRPLPGRSYYRIRQTDYNGQTDHSPIRSVERKPTSEFAVYPNPGAGRFTLTGYQDGDLYVYDTRGRRVPFTLTMGGELTLHHQAPGVYILELQRQYDFEPQRIRLVVQ